MIQFYTPVINAYHVLYRKDVTTLVKTAQAVNLALMRAITVQYSIMRVQRKASLVKEFCVDPNFQCKKIVLKNELVTERIGRLLLPPNYTCQKANDIKWFN